VVLDRGHHRARPGAGRRLGAAGLIALAFAACGGEPQRPAPTPQLPFPPQAQEPGNEIRPADGRPGKRVRVGEGAEGIAVDPQTGVAAIATSAGLVLVDAATGATKTTVKLPDTARHVSLARPGGPFLVPLENADQLAEVAPEGGEPRLTDVGEHPHDAAADEDGRIFVGNEFGASLSVVEDGKVVRTIKVAEQPGGVEVVGDHVAVVSVRAYVVELYDRKTLERESTQNAGYGPSHIVAFAGKQPLYVADTRGNGISIFTVFPRLRFGGRIAVPGKPYGMAIDPKGNRLYVTLTERNQLAEIDLLGKRVVRTFPTGSNPYSVAFDERTGNVLVVTRDGELQIVSP
jgi:DNA-binding beta-propeller fold protein YncE